MDAAEFLGKPVSKAVITIPAYFNNEQREAIMLAANIAGLTVLHLINEPTAAAIAAVLDKKYNAIRHILIFDLGGCTFDVSILFVDNDMFIVLATHGDSHLDGEDFTNGLFHRIFQNGKIKC